MFSIFERKKKTAKPEDESNSSGRFGNLMRPVKTMYKRIKLEKAMAVVYKRDGRKKPEFLDMPAEIQMKIAELCHRKDPESLRLSCRQINDIYVATKHNLTPPTAHHEKVEITWTLDDPDRVQLIVEYKKTVVDSKFTRFVRPDEQVLKRFLHLATAVNIEAGDSLPEYVIDKAAHLKKFLTTCRVKSVVIACHNSNSINILTSIFPERVRIYFHARHDHYMEQIPYLERFCGVNNLANGLSLNILESLKTNKKMTTMAIYLESNSPLITKYLDEWERKEREIHTWYIYIEAALVIDTDNTYRIRYHEDRTSDWLRLKRSVSDGVTLLEIALIETQKPSDRVKAYSLGAASDGQKTKLVLGQRKMERCRHVVYSEILHDNRDEHALH